MDTNINILTVVVSCKKYENLWPKIIDSNLKNYIILCGGADENKLIDNILYLKCDDNYIGLAEKMMCAFKFITESNFFSSVTHILKIDDNNVKISYETIEHISTKYKDILNQHDYIGQYLFGPPNRLNRKHHYGRVSEDSIWYNKEYTGDWVPFFSGGETYILSKKSLEILSREVNEYIKYPFEDVMIAMVLNKYNIKPYKFNYGVKV